MTGDPILSFDGEYRWLSNFYDYVLDVGGWMFPSAEHAFQAAKTYDEVWQKDIGRARSPSSAKRLGLSCPLRPDWESVKREVMRLVIEAKFPLTGALTPRLLATGDRLLVEGNNHGDRTWGATWEPIVATQHEQYPRWAWSAPGPPDRGLYGDNWLGLALMERRQQLREVSA